jgi:hypothetical protein
MSATGFELTFDGKIFERLLAQKSLMGPLGLKVKNLKYKK